MIDVIFPHQPKIGDLSVELLEFEPWTDIHCDMYDKSDPPKTATMLLIEALQRVNGTEIKDRETKRKLLLDMEVPERDFCFFRDLSGSDPGNKITIPYTCPYTMDCGKVIELPALVRIPERPTKEIDRTLKLILSAPIILEYEHKKFTVTELHIRHPNGHDIEAVYETRIKWGEGMMQRQLRARQIIDACGAPINTTLIGKMSLSDRRAWTDWEVKNRFVDIYQAAPCPACGKRILYQVSADPFFW